MTATRWHFEALDTWFFRESRPHEALGGSTLGSLFPPAARTVAGAVRTVMGQYAGVDWERFNNGDGRAHQLAAELDLRHEIGDAEDLGQLQLHGPWLCQNSKRLYPVPRFLLEPKTPGPLPRLRLGRPVRCGLSADGPVALPELLGRQPGAKTLDTAWVSEPVYQQILAGEPITTADLIKPAHLFGTEERLGIGRDNRRGTVIPQQLYMTRHLRPHAGTGLEVGVSGVDPRLQPPTGLTRFGGEGRLAAIHIQPTDTGPWPAAPALGPDCRRFLLVLLTPADLDGAGLPPGFEPVTTQGQTRWQGTLNGLELTVESAVIGKPTREGGWDLANHRPRPVRSLVPAGSAWFVTGFAADPADAVAALHGHAIGRETALGRGRLAVARWPESDT